MRLAEKRLSPFTTQELYLTGRGSVGAGQA